MAAEKETKGDADPRSAMLQG